MGDTVTNMSTLRHPPDRRTLAILGAAAFILLIAAIAVASPLRRGGDTFAGDPALRRTAMDAAARITSKQGKLPVPDASLDSFKAWGYNTHTAFVTIRQKSLPRGQFVQVQLSDPITLPPQFLTLDTGGRAAVGVDAAAITQALKSRKPVCTNVDANGTALRACIVALPTPVNLQPAGMTGIVEAFMLR